MILSASKVKFYIEIKRSGLFDEDFYRQRYPDVAGKGNVLKHFVRRGMKEGRWPNEQFDPFFYGQLYDDVEKSNLPPLIHYIRIGKAQNRLTCGDEGIVKDSLGQGAGTYISGAKTVYYEEARPVVKTNERADVFAFYLPQFHPIKENNEWWGRGFTEWTNVTKARPWFAGHIQPRLPADLGFYDLRLPEVMDEQAKLAKEFGIKGFCFHYYWFEGHRLLERPLDNLLERPEIDLPFFLCWANENWTRRWDGQESEVLISQNHSAEDDIAMISDIGRYMRDPRYYRINGRPLLIIYRPGILPEPTATIERWRSYCRENGIGEILIGGAMTFGLKNPIKLGFDIAVEFPPHNLKSLWRINGETDSDTFGFRGDLFDYRSYVNAVSSRKYPTGMKVVRTLIPGWDNSARRGAHATIFINDTPALYQQLLDSVIDTANPIEGSERPLVMVNAWNEWAEGAYLEPDRSFGHAFLNATARAVFNKPLGRILIPDLPSLRDGFYGAEVERYNYEYDNTSILNTILELGPNLLDYDQIILPGEEPQLLNPGLVSSAAERMQKQPRCGIATLNDKSFHSPFESKLDAIFKMELDNFLDLRIKPQEAAIRNIAFSDAVVVRTAIIRPLIKHHKVLKERWLSNQERYQFLNNYLGTLCVRQDFSIDSINEGFNGKFRAECSSAH